MHVYFEDWSTPTLLEQLDEQGVPHGGRIIRTFAAAKDPRLALGRQSIATEVVSGAAFKPDQIYEGEGGKVYSGLELEAALADYDLTNGGNHIARALSRFSGKYGFCAPDDIKGLAAARRNPAREKDLHFDVVATNSLRLLKLIADYDQPGALVDVSEGILWRGGSPAEIA